MYVFKVPSILLGCALLVAGCASEETQPAVSVSVEPEPVQPVYVPQVNTYATAAPVAAIDHAAYR